MSALRDSASWLLELELGLGLGLGLGLDNNIHDV